ncbi:TIGR01777 family oxidoreductase, partial [Chlamydiales bacterium]|nr:TIGR01777 family oxidoreductase [Chlamydiales bacterium]
SSMDVILATRDQKKASEPNRFYWDPHRGILNQKYLEGVDIVINLSGENLSSPFWTNTKKNKIFNSRIRSTELIAEMIASMEHPPKRWLNASAIGYYGDRGDEILTETSSPGSGFLAETCQKWEAATKKAEKRVPVAHLRFGIVLGKSGGALSKMLLPFRLGLGGKIGSGDQWMSWLSAIEVEGIVRHIVEKDLSGPINMVTPHPITNSEFTKVLGKALKKPTIFSIPQQILIGEMAKELLLSSKRVIPEKLLKSGYIFHHESLKQALEAIL